MCSGVGDRTCLLPGFPIRKSSDQSLVGSSPRLFAASYVLLRLLVPRHPPCALTNLATKMLASTVQFSNYGRSHSHAVRRLNWSDRGNGPAAVANGSIAPRKLRSLRTQQRAWAVHQRVPSFQPREVVLNWGALAAGRM